MSDQAYAVVITGIDPERKIQAIKKVREVTGLGMADAKSLVEDLPSKIMDGLYGPQASELCDLLSSVGMRVERQIDRSNPPTIKNLQRLSFDEPGNLAPGEEINIPIEGGGYLRISRDDDE
jgi:hypothetical protein